VSIDPAGFPFVIVAAMSAVVAAALGVWVPAVIFLVLAAAMAAFFRDPERSPPASPTLVLAPADGTVRFAGEAPRDGAPEGRWQQVTIFLSLLDVHVNRAPAGGRVVRVKFVKGTFLPAYRADAIGNEHSEIWLDVAGTTIVVRQVVGVLARRVVCRVKPGEMLAPGARIGVMKFGSRMDVFVPMTATLAVGPGDHVRAGETVIARLAAGDA